MTGMPEEVVGEEEAMESASVVEVGVFRDGFPFCCLDFLDLLEEDLRLRV